MSELAKIDPFKIILSINKRRKRERSREEKNLIKINAN